MSKSKSQKKAPKRVLAPKVALTRFEAEGASRTYWNFYLGFGLIIRAFLIISAVALWQVGSLVAADQSAGKPLTLTMVAAFVANGALAWHYFFCSGGLRDRDCRGARRVGGPAIDSFRSLACRGDGPRVLGHGTQR